MINGQAIMRMRWRYLLFAHWPIAVEALRPLIPPALEIDTFDGRAWVGLVPFTMEDVSPRFVPHVPLGLGRGLTDFHECNVRTYVYPRGRENDPSARGVWFFSLDAANRFAVWGARRYWDLPYFNARIALKRDGDVIDYQVQRLPSTAGQRDMPAMRIRWRALDPLPPSQAGDLAHFLTERYCLYNVRPSGRDRVLAVHCGRIAHVPWPLRRAELLSLDDLLVRAAGIEVDQTREPVLYHADVLNVRAHRLQCVG